jgi:hypothetical protein
VIPGKLDTSEFVTSGGTHHLRTAVIGMLSLRINEPDLLWPPLAEQADRFLAKLVGLTPSPGHPNQVCGDRRDGRTRR